MYSQFCFLIHSYPSFLLNRNWISVNKWTWTWTWTSCRQSWQDSRQDRAEIFATVNLLFGENLGEIRSSIPARFWPAGLLLPSENLGKIRGRIVPRFWPPRFLLLGENLGEIRGRIPARFWWDFVSRRESCRDPGEIPAGKKNTGSQNLAGIPTGFPPRSRRDPAKIPVLILQGYTLYILISSLSTSCSFVFAADNGC